MTDVVEGGRRRCLVEAGRQDVACSRSRHRRLLLQTGCLPRYMAGLEGGEGRF